MQLISFPSEHDNALLLEQLLIHISITEADKRLGYQNMGIILLEREYSIIPVVQIYLSIKDFSIPIILCLYNLFSYYTTFCEICILQPGKKVWFCQLVL